MVMTRKITFVIALFILLIAGETCSAERIGVYDYSIDSFCEQYNNTVKTFPDKSSILIDKNNMRKVNVNGGTLFFYPMRNCVNGNGTHIIFFLSPTNKIFEINITNNMNATIDDTIYAYIISLKVLGVREEDIPFFSDLSEPKYKRISSKKTLVAGFRPASAHKLGVDEYKIAAFAN